MSDAPAAAARSRVPAPPREVTAAVVLIVSSLVLAFLAGVSSGWTWSQAAWMAADGLGFSFVGRGEQVLMICFLHNLVWLPVRWVLAYQVLKGRRAARITALIAEPASLLVMVPLLFVSFDGARRHVEDTGLGLTQGLAVACICVSVAAFLLLAVDTVGEWCGGNREGRGSGGEVGDGSAAFREEGADHEAVEPGQVHGAEAPAAQQQSGRAAR
jgi:hypothetical protein